jgi:hypothetical protein
MIDFILYRYQSSFYTSHYVGLFVSFVQVEQLMESLIRSEGSETSILVR